MPRHFSTHKIICWRVTEHCNRACRFCLSLSSPKSPHPGGNPAAILARLSSLGVEKISYSGGEPMEFPNFDRLIERGASLGITQIMTTNGDELVRNIPSWISLLEYVKLSFYGDQRLHDRYMGAGHYVSQLELARKLRTEHNVIVGVNYMVTPLSIEVIPLFVGDCDRVGVDNIMFQTYILNGRVAVDSKLKLIDTRPSIQRVRELVSPFTGHFKGGIKIHDYTKKNWFMVLTPGALLTLPSSDGTPDFAMGSIFDQYLALPDGTNKPAPKALEEIWSMRYETDAIVVFDEGIVRVS